MLRDYLPVLLQIIVVALFAVSALLVSILVGKRGRRTRAREEWRPLFFEAICCQLCRDHAYDRFV